MNDENLKNDENNKKFKDNNERLEYLNKKQTEIAENQEKELVLDFDEALREESKKTFKVKLNGISYDMPKDMPMSFSTYLVRKCYKKIKGEWHIVMPDQDNLYMFIEKMFGKKFMMDIERSNNKALSMTFVFNTIVPGVFAQWKVPLNTSNSNIEKKIMSQGL